MNLHHEVLLRLTPVDFDLRNRRAELDAAPKVIKKKLVLFLERFMEFFAQAFLKDLSHDPIHPESDPPRGGRSCFLISLGFAFMSLIPDKTI